LYGEQVHKKKIWIHNQVPAGLLIRSDKGMLQVVLRNLISNAIKFTSEGGDIWINYRSDKEFHYLDVKDTGVGMSDAILRTLFTNSTISMAGTNNESGTGLGLSICKEFLSKDDGSLRVESIPGWFRFYRSTAPSGNQKAPSKGAKEKLHQRHFLSRPAKIAEPGLNLHLKNT
jgi:signal transduction histidine kinase